MMKLRFCPSCRGINYVDQYAVEIRCCFCGTDFIDERQLEYRMTFDPPDLVPDTWIDFGFDMLRHGEWRFARLIAERVISLDRRNAYAYLITLMSERFVSSIPALRNCEESFEEDPDFILFCKYAKHHEVSEVLMELELCKERIFKADISNIYHTAVALMRRAQTEGEYLQAAELFQSISEDCFVDAYYAHCLKQAESFCKKRPILFSRRKSA